MAEFGASVWESIDVCAWLESLGIAIRVIDEFYENGISGKDLPRLGHAELKDFGLQSYSQRSDLLFSIRELCSLKHAPFTFTRQKYDFGISWLSREEKDEVFPPYGESEYDTDEQDEEMSHWDIPDVPDTEVVTKISLAKSNPLVDVDEIMAQCIRKFENIWDEKKRPRLEMQRVDLWHRMRWCKEDLRFELDVLENKRIYDMINAIKSVSVVSSSECTRLAGILQESIYLKCEITWKLNLANLEVEPSPAPIDPSTVKKKKAGVIQTFKIHSEDEFTDDFIASDDYEVYEDDFEDEEPEDIAADISMDVDDDAFVPQAELKSESEDVSGISEYSEESSYAPSPRISAKKIEIVPDKIKKQKPKNLVIPKNSLVYLSDQNSSSGNTSNQDEENLLDEMIINVPLKNSPKKAALLRKINGHTTAEDSDSDSMDETTFELSPIKTRHKTQGIVSDLKRPTLSSEDEDSSGTTDDGDEGLETESGSSVESSSESEDSNEMILDDEEPSSPLSKKVKEILSEIEEEEVDFEPLKDVINRKSQVAENDFIGFDDTASDEAMDEPIDKSKLTDKFSSGKKKFLNPAEKVKQRSRPVSPVLPPRPFRYQIGDRRVLNIWHLYIQQSGHRFEEYKVSECLKIYVYPVHCYIEAFRKIESGRFKDVFTFHVIIQHYERYINRLKAENLNFEDLNKNILSFAVLLELFNQKSAEIERTTVDLSMVEEWYKEFDSSRLKKLRKSRSNRAVKSIDESNADDVESSSSNEEPLNEETLEEELEMAKQRFKRRRGIRDHGLSISSVKKRKKDIHKHQTFLTDLKTHHYRDALSPIVVNISKEENVPDLIFPEFMGTVLKPHQIDGVRFMWNCLGFSNHSDETIDGGCILAHAMGLGKTFQVIAVIFMVFYAWKHEKDTIPGTLRVLPRISVLILAPATVLDNWKREWNLRIPPEVMVDCVRKVYSSSSMNSKNRLEKLHEWHKFGGVFLMSYELFRELTKEEETDDQRVMVTYLQRPGPDIIICDEGHRIKNPSTQLNNCLQKVKTLRRVCLTGYPLQNNLDEYFNMVDFIRPGQLEDLGTFRIKYGRPIEAAFALDCTAASRKYGQRRLYVLHKLLEPFVFRLDNKGKDPSAVEKVTENAMSKYKSVINSTKIEFVIKCKLSGIQYQLYELFVTSGRDNSQEGMSLLDRLCELRFIVNHPICIFKKMKSKAVPEISGEADVQRYTPDYGTNSNPIKLDDSDNEIALRKRNAAAAGNFVSDDDDSEEKEVVMPILGRISSTVSKIYATLPDPASPVAESDQDYIQELLTEHYSEVKFLRLDGSVPVAKRQKIIDNFNNKEMGVSLFLISTTAGCLGVNCQSASRVILFDSNFNPCNEEQAIARAYRYGQKNTVYVYRLCTYDTVEDTLYKRCVQKVGLAKLVVDKKETGNKFGKSELADYFKLPEKEPFPVDPEDVERCLKQDRVLNVVYKEHKGIIVELKNHSGTEFDYQLAGDELTEADIYLNQEKQRISRSKIPKRNKDVTKHWHPDLRRLFQSHSKLEKTYKRV